MTMDEMLARAMADPTSMDPTMLAAALPQLQSQVRQHCNTSATPLQQNWNTTRRAYGHIGVTSMCGLDARKRHSFGISALYRHLYSILYTALFHFDRALFFHGLFYPICTGLFSICMWLFSKTNLTTCSSCASSVKILQQYGNSTANLLC